MRPSHTAGFTLFRPSPSTRSGWAAAAGAGADAAAGGGGPGMGLSIEEIDEGGEVAGHGVGGLTIEEPDEQDPIPEIDED